MEIITAEQARDITKLHIPYNLHNTVMYAMNKIAEAANRGDNIVEFHDGTTVRCYLESISSDEFKEYITSLGYRYTNGDKEQYGRNYEWVIISW